MRFIALTGEEGALRLIDGREIESGPGKYLAEDGTLYYDVTQTDLQLREFGTLSNYELELYDFDGYGFKAHFEWDGSNHILVEED